MHVNSKVGDFFGGNVRHVQVRLEDKEYQALTQKAEKRGVAIQQAVREAVMEWSGQKPTGPFVDIGKDEERLLHTALQAIRERPGFREIVEALIRLNKQGSPHQR